MSLEEKQDFGKLLQESRLLNARIRSGGHGDMFLPQLQRGLEQIEEVSLQAATRHAQKRGGGEYDESRAALFLATQGYDLSKINGELAKLNSIIPLAVQNVGEAFIGVVAFDADVDAFLQGELDSIVFSAIEHVNAMAIKKADGIVQRRKEERWTQIKQDVTKKLSSGSSDFAKDSAKSMQSIKMETYSRVITALNGARLRGSSPNIAEKVERALNKLDGADPRNEVLLDCWRALESILMGPNLSEGSGISPAEDDENVFVAREAAKLDRGGPQLVLGSRRFLENSFLRFIDRTLAQYPRDAMLGGRPSAMERVRAFCEIKFKRLPPAELTAVEVLSGGPAWMVLFHLVRAGLLRDALAYAQSVESFLSRSDSNFVAYLKAWSVSQPNSLTGTSLNQIRSEFMSMMQHGRADPYKVALFKIIGKCDLSRKSVADAIQTSEDYLWLQLWLIDDGSAAQSSDVPDTSLAGPGSSLYSLRDLQAIITDFGAKHFDPKQSNPHHYFGILLMVGLFEKALEYLYASGHQLDAVHFAISLCQADALTLAASSEPLFSPSNTVNLAAMLQDFAKQLVPAGDVMISVHYLLLLSLAGRRDYDLICHTAIRDVILASGDFASLLGETQSQGNINQGSLAQYARLMNLKDERAFMDVITSAAALKCEQEGRFRECIQLYNLACKYDRVMTVLCSRLSRSFLIAYNAAESEDLRRIAESILSYYNTQTHISAAISPTIRTTCHTLLQLSTLRKLTEDGRWTEAIQELLKLEILPLEGDIAAISSASDRVKDLSDYLSTLLPELLLMTMTAIVKGHAELRSFIGVDAGRAQQSDFLKRMARNLMTFVGMLRLRIPQDVYSQIARMEISIN